MKNFLQVIATVFVLTSIVFAQQPQFEQYFKDQTMRIDYYHTGDSDSQTFAVDEIYLQGIWAGSTTHLIDKFNQGRYYAKVYDTDTGQLIFSKGFDSIFGEYQTTTPAQNGVNRTYHETVLIPCPKDSVRFAIEARDKQNNLHEAFTQVIDPNDVNVIKEPVDGDIQVIDVVTSGDPHTNVDVAILAEGYAIDEIDKVTSDLEKFKGVFFGQEPYKSHMDKFNVYGVFKPSFQSGTDEPTHGTFRNTAVNTSFNSLNSPRYLLTEDNKAMRDIAAVVPYDALFIMVNHKRYGGGGIYNLYCTFTTDNQWYEYLFVHEFGHSFAGLGDEYYTSSTAYNDFYPKGVEPTEPNVTALLDPPNVKWAEYVSPDIEIPTPWAKAKYDSMSNAYQAIRGELNNKIARMKRDNAPEEEIADLEERAESLSKEHADTLDEFLENSPYAGKVGAFEGAGYSSEGLYRPMLDCIMFSKGSKPYCTVCEQAIIDVIEYYSE